jgi:hypothetical protein
MKQRRGGREVTFLQSGFGKIKERELKSMLGLGALGRRKPGYEGKC